MTSFAVISTTVLSLYFVVWFFDAFFKSCMHYPYYAFLEGTGLKIGILNFTWTTTAFNRSIYRWSKDLTRFLQKWYTCGYIVTICIFLPYCIWALCTIVHETFSNTLAITDEAPELKAMVPGVNIPISDFWVYFISITFGTIFHELGHALAAAQHDVQLISVGIFVFTIIPIAFVQLNTEHLNSLPVTKRLSIYCAGVWHNVVTAFVAMVLFLSTPTLLSIAYESGSGLRVTGFTTDSPLRVERGLHIDDVITSINNCDVRYSNDWTHCLHAAHNRFGICKSIEFIADNDEVIMDITKKYDVVQCCTNNQLQSFCFENMEPELATDSVLTSPFACLKPANMVGKTFTKCDAAKGYSCPIGEYCMRPSLNNDTFFLIIQTRNDNIFYLGLPYDIYNTVFIDEYIPRSRLFTFFSPTNFQKLLKYLFTFSMGIGLLNVLPCYSMDGHHITRNLIQILANYLNQGYDFVHFFTMLTVMVGTVVTGPMVLYLFYSAFQF